MGMKWYLNVIIIISLIINDVHNFYMSLSLSSVFSSKVCVYVLCHFILVFILLLLISRNALYIYESRIYFFLVCGLPIPFLNAAF